MDEKEVMINPCYILGTALLFKNSLDRMFLDRINGELSKDYEVDLSEKNIVASIKEWKDFFRLTEDNKVVLTKEAVCNKFLVRFLFCDVLDKELYDKLVQVILNKKEKTKKLRFPK